MNLDQLVEKFSEHKCYLSMGSGKMANQFKANVEDVKAAKKLVKSASDYELTKGLIKKYHLANMHTIPSRNVLVIGDLHAPFIKEGYLEFCKEIYIKHNCNEVVFMGGIVDSHFQASTMLTLMDIAQEESYC